MDFSDLSEYDLNLIRSLATGLLTNTKMNCRFEALTETVLSCIYAKGFQITPYPDRLFLTISKSLKDKGYNRQWPSSDVINEVFVEIKKLNLTISKDESRDATWSSPRPSWYQPYFNNKKPWSIF